MSARGLSSGRVSLDQLRPAGFRREREPVIVAQHSSGNSPGRAMPVIVRWHIGLGEWAGRVFLSHVLWLLGVLAGGVIGGLGAATLALAAVARRFHMEEVASARGLWLGSCPTMWREFWQVWRREWCRGNLLGLVLGLGWALLLINRFAVIPDAGALLIAARALGMILTVLWGVFCLLIWPIAAHFDESMGRVAVMTVAVLLSRLRVSLCLLGVVVACIWLTGVYPGVIAVFGIALPVWVATWLCWRQGLFALPDTAQPAGDQDASATPPACAP